MNQKQNFEQPGNKNGVKKITQNQYGLNSPTRARKPIYIHSFMHLEFTTNKSK